MLWDRGILLSESLSNYSPFLILCIVTIIVCIITMHLKLILKLVWYVISYWYVEQFDLIDWNKLTVAETFYSLYIYIALWWLLYCLIIFSIPLLSFIHTTIIELYLFVLDKIYNATATTRGAIDWLILCAVVNLCLSFSAVCKFEYVRGWKYRALLPYWSDHVINGACISA